MTLDELLAALPGLSPEARVRGWLRVVDHAMSATPAQLEALDRALAGWPARSRPAWGAWYATFERVEQTGPWDEGYEIFSGLIEPTSPAFALARHVGMWFDQGVGAAAIDELARWPWLKTITSVSLATVYRADVAEAILRFLQNPATRHLRELTLGLAAIGPELVESILGAVHQDIERVWIHDVRLELRFAELLADFLDTHSYLIGLALHACPLGAAGIGLLVERGCFDRLSELTLRNVRLDDEAANRWANRRSPGRLRVLDLEEEFFDGNHMMRGPGLIALAEAGWLDGVESLVLSYHHTTGDAFARILDRADLSRLRHLRLHCTGFDANAAEQLREAEGKLPALEQIELAYSQLADEAAAELVESFASRRARNC
jgi:hypothetical protein